MLAEFDHEMGTTRRLLERVPDAQLAWKPHEKSMSLGGLATHLSNLPNWGTTILNDASYDLAAGPPNMTEGSSREAILAVLRRIGEDDAQVPRQDRCGAEYALDSPARRSGDVLAAARSGVPDVRAVPHRPSSRAVERVPPAEQHSCSGNLRADSRRRVTQDLSDREIRSSSFAGERTHDDALQLGQPALLPSPARTDPPLFRRRPRRAGRRRLSLAAAAVDMPDDPRAARPERLERRALHEGHRVEGLRARHERRPAESAQLRRHGASVGRPLSFGSDA